MDKWTRKAYDMQRDNQVLRSLALRAINTDDLWTAAQQLKGVYRPYVGDWAALVSWTELAVTLKEEVTRNM